MCPRDVPSGFVSQPLIILVADLSGYARSFDGRSDPEMAGFLDRYYRAAESIIASAAGTVIKFMGDSVLATFPSDLASEAVAAAIRLEAVVGQVAEEEGLTLSLGANLHAGSAVQCELGSGPSRRLDVVGRAVNQAFLMGRGSGIRISEPVYRKLPSGERSPWEKRKPPVVYLLGAGGKPYEGLRKSATENASRW